MLAYGKTVAYRKSLKPFRMIARDTTCHWNELSAILNGMIRRVDRYLTTSKQAYEDTLA